jgi:hypothetical protein
LSASPPATAENALYVSYALCAWADALCWLDHVFGRIWPALFAYQTVLEAEVDEQAATDLLRETQLAAPYVEWIGGTERTSQP